LWEFGLPGYTRAAKVGGIQVTDINVMDISTNHHRWLTVVIAERAMAGPAETGNDN